MKSEMSGIPVFVTAAESASFSQAAEKLHLTCSAVAKTIGRLEVRLPVDKLVSELPAMISGAEHQI